MIKEDQDFDLCGLLKDQLLENIDLTKKTQYPYNFGTLITCIVMYFLNCFPLDNNMAWRVNEPVYKKIYIHFKNLAKCDEVYESFFESL